MTGGSARSLRLLVEPHQLVHQLIAASQRAQTLLRETRGQREAAKGVEKLRRRGR
jgi:hypothetical protein